jgi:hypothetical protein
LSLFLVALQAQALRSHLQVAAPALSQAVRVRLAPAQAVRVHLAHRQAVVLHPAVRLSQAHPARALKLCNQLNS